MSGQSPTVAVPGGPATTLGRWAAELPDEAIPARVRERALDILIDAVACAFVGRGSGETAQITTVARHIGAEGDATIIGGDTLGPAAACLVNGYQITAYTMTDIHHPTFCHIAPEVVPPALAIGERIDPTGRQLLTAIALGLETTVRIGLGIDYPAARARGWHMPGVIGPFGGAVAGARILGLDADRMRAALGLAGSQSAGTFAHWLTPTVKFQQARGALGGLLAAELAATGFRTSLEVFTHSDGGIFHAFAEGGRPEAMLGDLGERWELEQITLRRWPAAAANQAVVEGLLELLGGHDVAPDEIGHIRIGLSDFGFRLVGDVGWEDPFRALLSPRYVASVVVHDRRCWVEQFTRERVADPVVGAFAASRVEVAADERIRGSGAHVTITFRDGRQAEVQHDPPKGDAARPLERQDLVDKYRDGTDGAIDRDAADRLLTMLTDLDAQPSSRAVIRAMRAAPVVVPA